MAAVERRASLTLLHGEGRGGDAPGRRAALSVVESSGGLISLEAYLARARVVLDEQPIGTSRPHLHCLSGGAA